MKFIATHDAIDILNASNLTEIDVYKEFKSFKNLEDGNIEVKDLIFNWKNENLIIAPIGKNSALIMVYGEELNQSYEDLPEIIYKNNEWHLK
jgi:hypothetical protein